MTKYTTIGFLFFVLIVLTDCRIDNNKNENFDRKEEFLKILKTYDKINLNTRILFYPKSFCQSCKNKTTSFILQNPNCIIIHEINHHEKCNISKNCIHLSKYQINSMYGLYFQTSVTMNLSNGELSKFRII